MKNKFNIIVILVLVVLCAVLAVYSFSDTKKNDDVLTYHAVYMKTGELYFGVLSRFPHFRLTHVYMLQSTRDPQNPLSIQKFSQVFWGPEDVLNLNRDEVVWIAKLDSQGQLAQLLKTNPNLTSQGSLIPSGSPNDAGIAPGNLQGRNSTSTKK